MKKVIKVLALVAALAVGSSGSTLKEITTDVNGSDVNLGELKYEVDCGFGCDMTSSFKKIFGGHIDYVVYDENGNLADKGVDRIEKLSFYEDPADQRLSKIVIRPVAVDTESAGGQLPLLKARMGFESDTWHETPATRLKKIEGLGAAEASKIIPAVGLKGGSIGTAVGLGLLGAALSDNSPLMQNVYYVSITEQNGNKQEAFVRILAGQAWKNLLKVRHIVENIVNYVPTAKNN